MTGDYKRHLIDGDPVAREAELDAIDAQAMRRQVMTEARNQPATLPLLWWLSPLALASAVAVCLMLPEPANFTFRAPLREPAAPRGECHALSPNFLPQSTRNTPGNQAVLF